MDGRTYYRFDSGRSAPLLAIVFDTLTHRLVSLNNMVVPLSKFLSITEMDALKPHTENTGLQLRADPHTLSQTDFINCRTNTGESFKIPCDTVILIIQALQTLAVESSENKADEDKADEGSDEGSDEDSEDEADENEADEDDTTEREKADVVYERYRHLIPRFIRDLEASSNSWARFWG
jgi:hypothetical protein